MNRADFDGLSFGDALLALPDAWRDAPVLRGRGLAAIPDTDQRIAACAEDIAERGASLDDGSTSIPIVVPDRTRPVDLPRIAGALARALGARGIPSSRLVVVPASGIHRPMTTDEIARWTGISASAGPIRIAAHDADAPGCLAGTTASGTRVVAHPAVARAAFVIAIGRVVFHYLAGFGGGRKMLVPGIAARSTILAVHSRCLAPTERGGGRDPRARAGLLSGNPVHEAACEAARLLPPAIGVHVSLASDGAIASIDAGDLFESHARACAVYASAHRVACAAPFDAVIVSAGSRAAGRDLVQAHKALDAVAPIVRDGGTIVLVARCEDGIGNREVLDALALGSPAAIEAALRARFTVGGHTALALLAKTTRLTVLAVTDLDDEALRLARIERVRSLHDASTRLRAEVGQEARIAIAPCGASALYQLGEPADEGL